MTAETLVRFRLAKERQHAYERQPSDVSRHKENDSATATCEAAMDLARYLTTLVGLVSGIIRINNVFNLFLELPSSWCKGTDFSMISAIPYLRAI